MSGKRQNFFADFRPIVFQTGSLLEIPLSEACPMISVKSDRNIPVNADALLNRFRILFAK